MVLRKLISEPIWMDMRSDIMIWGIFALSIFFAVIEYFQHREYREKHPDYARCTSGVIGFCVLALALLIEGIKG